MSPSTVDDLQLSRADAERLADSRGLAHRLVRLADRLRASYTEAVAQLGMTAVQARALSMLDQPLRMRDLADLLSCDRSNITQIADRLEGLGLVERVPGADRRVTLLALTEAGARARLRLDEHVARWPWPSDRLDAAQRATLRQMLDVMLDEGLGEGLGEVLGERLGERVGDDVG